MLPEEFKRIYELVRVCVEEATDQYLDIDLDEKVKDKIADYIAEDVYAYNRINHDI